MRTALGRLTSHPAVSPEGVVVVAVSVGVAPALAALADAAAGTHVRLVVSLGGYADARELIRYFTTGAYRFDGITGRIPVDPALARAFLAANLDLVRDPADRAAIEAVLGGRPPPPTLAPEARAVLAVLANQDPARTDALLDALPSETRALLDALSPARYAPRLPGRLVLVHGRGDPAIPFTESLRLAAAAAPGQTRLVLVDAIGHVEGRRAQVRDLLRLWGVTYEMFRG